MAILEHIRNSIPYRLYANGSLEGPHSKCGSRLRGIILGFEKISRLYSIFISIGLHANGSLEGSHSNCVSSWIPRIILGIEKISSLHPLFTNNNDHNEN